MRAGEWWGLGWGAYPIRGLARNDYGSYRTDDKGLTVQGTNAGVGAEDSFSVVPLGVGNTGIAVRRLQASLRSAGYSDVAVDGIYGEATAAAVRAFQVAYDIEPSGRADRQTWDTLRLVTTPESVMADLQSLTLQQIPFTPLTFARPDPPPSALWLVLMPLVPLVGGGLTYMNHRWQAYRVGRRAP